MDERTIAVEAWRHHMKIKTAPPEGFTVITVSWRSPRRYKLLRMTGVGEWHEVGRPFYTSWEAASTHAWAMLGQEHKEVLHGEA